MRSSFSSDQFTFAFQPIVDVSAGLRPFAYEALVRGRNGEPAETVFSQIADRDMLAFDAACRCKAVGMAAFFGIRAKLSLNISAAAICDYRFGLHSTLRAASLVDWPAERLIFEMTEHAPVKNPAKLMRWMAAARNRGVTVAIDDFGAGYASINGLLQLRPHMLKLDMQLVRDIDTDASRQAMVRGILETCKYFDCAVVAEGVETDAEFRILRECGVRLMQGYLFAGPAFESIPQSPTGSLSKTDVRDRLSSEIRP